MHRFGGSHAVPAAGADIFSAVTVRTVIAACGLACGVSCPFAARCVVAFDTVHIDVIPTLFQNKIAEGFCRFCDAPADARIVADFQVAGLCRFLKFFVVIRAASAAILYAVLQVP